jgi:hypothetical protein
MQPSLCAPYRNPARYAVNRLSLTWFLSSGLRCTASHWVAMGRATNWESQWQCRGASSGTSGGSCRAVRSACHAGNTRFYDSALNGTISLPEMRHQDGGKEKTTGKKEKKKMRHQDGGIGSQWQHPWGLSGTNGNSCSSERSARHAVTIAHWVLTSLCEP